MNDILDNGGNRTNSNLGINNRKDRKNFVQRNIRNAF